MRVIQSDGTVQDEIKIAGSPYDDKGLVIDATNMAAGATVYSPWYDNVAWVRNIVALATSDQQYDAVSQRRDSSLTSAFDIAFATAQPANGPGYRSHLVAGGPGLLGTSARLGIKNSSATANTYAKLRVQLLGM